MTDRAPESPFADPDFGFTARLALGGSYYGTVDPGRLFAILDRITPADFDSAWQSYHDAGAETTQGLRRNELLRLIRVAGREPVERDTAYRRVERNDETTFAILA